jgi:transcriptional regulator with XRE-family HTH domain
MRRRVPDEERLPSLSPNQVVAYNLPRARLVRGWTQEQAAEALAPYLGTKWSVANFSAIERSVDGGRIRQFTADDLFALSRAFRLPIGFFLTPPGDDPRTYGIATPDAGRDGLDPMELLDAVLGTDETMEVWEHELKLFGVAAGHRVRLRDGKFEDVGRNVPDQRDRVKRLVNARLKMLFQAELGDLPTAKAALGTVMALLDGLGEEDVPVEPDEPRPASRSRRKPA